MLWGINMANFYLRVLKPLGCYIRVVYCMLISFMFRIACLDSIIWPEACSSKVPKSFHTRKALESLEKPQTFWPQNCCIGILSYEQRFFFVQEVSGACIHFPFLDKDELKMALRARKISGAFEKRAPGENELEVFLLATSYFKKTIEAWPLFLGLLCNQTENSRQTNN